jgi:ATP-dependent Lon protease
LVDASAALTTSEGKDLQEVLASPDMHSRLYKTLQLLKNELELVRLKQKIGKQLEQTISDRQRQNILREQLKAIKKELGIETDEKETLSTRFKQRLDALKVPEHAMVVINEEMTKLQLAETTSSEFGIVRNYLDWLTILPWGHYTVDSLDIEHAQRMYTYFSLSLSLSLARSVALY